MSNLARLSLHSSPRRYRSLRLMVVLLVLFSFAAIACSRGLNPTGGWAAPVLTDDGVIVADRNGDLIEVDGRNGSFTASPAPLFPGDAADIGKVYGTPLVTKDAIYLSAYDCSGDDCEANVVALDPSSGDSLWAPLRQFTPIGQDEGSRDGSPPAFNIETEIVGDVVLHGDTLIFGTSEIGDDDDPGGFLMAIDATPGSVGGSRVKWMFPVGERVWSTPVIRGDTAYFTSMDSRVYAIDLADDDRYVYQPDARGQVDERVDREQRRLLWSFTADGALTAEPLIVDGKLYVGDFEGKFYALDLEARAADKTGAVLDSGREWVFNAGNWIWAKAVIEDGVIYTGTLSGDVYALDVNTGQPVWPEKAKIDGQIIGEPVLFDGAPRQLDGRVDRLLAVPSGSDDVWIIDAKTGQELGKFNTDSGVKSSPVVSDGLLFVHTLDRELQWFSTRDRAQLGCLKLQTGVACG